MFKIFQKKFVNVIINLRSFVALQHVIHHVFKKLLILSNPLHILQILFLVTWIINSDRISWWCLYDPRVLSEWNACSLRPFVFLELLIFRNHFWTFWSNALLTIISLIMALIIDFIQSALVHFLSIKNLLRLQLSLFLWFSFFLITMIWRCLFCL